MNKTINYTGSSKKSKKFSERKDTTMGGLKDLAMKSNL